MEFKIKALKEISLLLKGHKEDAKLLIEKKKGRYFFSVKENIPEDLRLQTYLFFCEIFPLSDLNHTNFDKNPPYLTKSRLRKIWIQMAAHKKGSSIAFKTFDEVINIFLGQEPKLEDFRIDKTKSSGKGLKGLMEKVFLQWHHFFSIEEEKDPIKKMLRDIEYLCSRMADREFREDDYVYLSDGIYDVDKVLIGGGAYLSILRKESDPLHIKIVARGTAIRASATGSFLSSYNDIQLEVGNLGVKTVWPKLSRYLKKEKIKSVELLGKSLGGVHSQKLAILIAATHSCKITSITTLCSIGVGEKTNYLFNKTLEEKYHAETPITIRVVRNGGRDGKEQPDYLPLFGGDHLGAFSDPAKVRTKIYTIAQSTEEKEKVEGPDLKGHSIFKLFKAFQSFTDGHIRQITLSNFTYSVQEDPSVVQKELQKGRELEKYRQTAAWALVIATGGLINEKCYTTEVLFEKNLSRVPTVFQGNEG